MKKVNLVKSIMVFVFIAFLGSSTGCSKLERNIIKWNDARKVRNAEEEARIANEEERKAAEEARIAAEEFAKTPEGQAVERRKQAIEKKAQLIMAERQAKFEQEKREKEQEKREKELALKREKENKLKDLEREKEKAEEKKRLHVKNLMAGKIPIKTIDDAVLYYNATDGYNATMVNPPLKADNKFYYVDGNIIGEENNYYQVEIKEYIVRMLKRKFPRKYAAMEPEPNYYFKFKLSKKLSSTNFRINQHITIVGRLINIESYMYGDKISSRKRYQPVFEAFYISK
jgi:hypothetical protein